MNPRSRPAAMHSKRSALINVMVQAAYKASKGLLRDFGELENLQVSSKGFGNFVTAADIRAEKVIHEYLSTARPGYSFLMEESGYIEGSEKDYTWIIDPLDGTTNFMHGLPQFCISIALRHKDETIAGVIYNPLHDELFWAEKGVGAYASIERRERRIRVANRRKLNDSLVCIGYHDNEDTKDINFYDVYRKLRHNCAGIRKMGSSALALAYFAAGRFDAVWLEGHQPWDIAASLVIIREAGGFIRTRHNKEDFFASGSVVACNDTLHKPLNDIIKP